MKLTTGGFETGGFETGGFETGGFETGGFETGGFETGGFETGFLYCKVWIDLKLTTTDVETGGFETGGVFGCCGGTDNRIAGDFISSHGICVRTSLKLILSVISICVDSISCHGKGLS